MYEERNEVILADVVTAAEVEPSENEENNHDSIQSDNAIVNEATKIALRTEAVRCKTADDSSNDKLVTDSSSEEEEELIEEVVHGTVEDLDKQLQAVIEESRMKRENWTRNILEENG